jgi:hypothetical protein
MGQSWGEYILYPGPQEHEISPQYKAKEMQPRLSFLVIFR